MLQLIVGWLLGFVSAIFAEPLRKWIYSPKLKLEFGASPEFRSRTPEEATFRQVVTVHSVHEAEYVRVRATNIRQAVAMRCRAYLVAVERMGGNGEFQATIYCDSIPLAWSCRNEQAYDPVDLPSGVAQFIDVVSTRSQANTSSDFRVEIKPMPYRYLDLFAQQGTFRFTIQVSGENVKPVFIKIVFGWRGIWNDYDAELG